MIADTPARLAATTALAPAIWGSTYLVTTELLPPDRPLLATVVRLLPAGLVLLVLVRPLPRGIWRLRLAVLGVLNTGALNLLLFVAAYRLPGGIAAVLAAVSPVMVLVLGALLLQERITAAHAVAGGLGVAGVALLVLRGPVTLDAVGVAAALGAAGCMALGITVTKRWGHPGGIGMLAVTGWQLAAGGLVVVPLALVVEGPPPPLTAANLVGFGYLAVFGALISYLLWFRGMARLPAVTVSFLALTSPVVATLLGLVVLGQTLSVVQLVGVAAVGAAVVIALPRPTRERIQTR